jgi:extracellular elastinolytic metalloproteinase
MKAPLKKIITACLLFCSGLALGQTTEISTVKTYLEQNKTQLNLSPADYNDVIVTRSFTEKETGIQRIYTQQKIAGIDVEGGSFSLHINTKTNSRIGTSNLLPLHLFQKDAAIAVRSAEFAARTALDHLKVPTSGLQLKEAFSTADKKTIFKRSEVALWDVPVRLVYLADDKNQKLRLTWQVQVYETNKQHYWVLYVDDQSGKILRKVDLVMHCQFAAGTTDANNHQQHDHDFGVNNITDVSPGIPVSGQDNLRGTTGANNEYRVYDLPYEAPTDLGATHSLITNPGHAVASTDGWHKVANSSTYNYTRGNNAYAFYDPSPGPLGGVPNPATAAFNNGGVGGTPALIEPFKFDYPIDLTQQPENYRNAAIVNLFYWNNLIHDVFYQFGFNEDNGAFQSSHIFSDGQHGSSASLTGQNDEVWAQAQDGGGTNNANFLTLPDGLNGQMQMYLWTASIPDSLVQITSSTNGAPPAGKKYYSVQGSFNSTFNSNLNTNPLLNKQFVIVKKNALSTVGTDSEGCATGQQSIALPPSNDVSGKIVLIDRGNCSFVEKVLGAQLGGAAGVIIINNTDGEPIAMGGSDAPGNVVTIPSVMITKADGEYLKAQIAGGATIIGSLKQDNPPAPKRDGDIDNGVISHEYGHGISYRLTGGPSALGPLGGDEQGGEGWSDFIALYMITRTNDLQPATATHPNGVLPNKGIGTYVAYQGINTGGGIRPTRYSIDKSVNPTTFKDIAKGGEITVPHGVGYIWCSMLYEMLQGFVDQYGFNDNVYFPANPTGSNSPAAGSGGNNVAMRLVLEGMKLQPTAPTFQQQRDAILKADTLLYGGQHACTIWKAFAKRGLGYSARSGSNALGDEVQGFDLPNACAPNQVRMNIKMQAPERIDNNTIINYTVSVQNQHSAAIPNVIVEDSIPAGTSLIAASDAGVQVGNKVKWNLASLAAGNIKDLTMQLSVNLPSASQLVFFDDHEAVSKFTSDGRPNTWQLVTGNAYSGTKSWYAQEVENPAHNVTLTQVAQMAVPATGAKLSFYHKFNTEQGFDGGLVEISTDNGVNWTNLPPAKFEKNGYNSIIATLDNPNIGTTDLAAFSGATNGYINSVADLGDYAGQQVRIRFRYTCDAASLASGPNPGWYIDDVYLIRNLTTITNYANLSLATGTENLFDSTGNLPMAEATTIVFDNSALPTSTSALAAAARTNLIRLSWKTFAEIRNSGFELERKTENETNYRSIGFIKGAGNSTQQKEYTYNDADVKAGVYYYYRLKQKDDDGKFSYSNVAVAKLGLKDNGYVFDVMPNPATTNASLVVSTPGRKTGTIKVYDAMGKPVTTFNAASAYNSVQKFDLNVAGLPAGTYWIELVVDDVKITKRLIVTR